MLSAIASDPTAIPLWITLLFAVAMYPLGLLLPGCVCCGGGNCTTCGSLTAPYESQVSSAGMMCCKGTLAASVTMRITHQGDSPQVTITRGTPNPFFNNQYGKTTKTYQCADIDGDYVLSLRGGYYNYDPCFKCAWGYRGVNSAGSFMDLYLSPDNCINTPLSFPNWRLFWLMQPSIRVTTKTQTCSGYPDLETCNIGTTSTSVQQSYNDWGAMLRFGTQAYAGPYGVQQCTPVSALIAPNLVFDDSVLGPCSYRVEIL